VLNLLRRLNRGDGRTIVVVLHDLNLACRYADHIIAMRSGRIVAEGFPAEVVTAETIRAVFDLDCQVIEDPLSKTPLVVPALEAHP
jgi:iron complex transport system ATP-binding protein